MEIPLIGTIDIFLLPIYCLLLFFIFRYIKKKYPDNILIQKYFIKGFVVKLLGGIFFGFLVYYYYGVGDTLSYFKESLQLRDLLAEGKISLFQIFTYDYSYFHDKFDLLGSVTNSGFIVTKISFILTYFSFSRFIVATAIMAALTYFGIFKLFETFVSMAPASHRLISFFVLFFPTVVIYGSGIFKDPICISALGWLFYSIYKIEQTRKLSFVNAFIFLVSIYFIVIVKAYIIGAFMFPLVFSIILILINKINNSLFKTMALPILVLIFAVLYNVFKDDIDDMLGQFAIERLGESVKGLQASYASMSEDDAGSNFDIGEIEPNLFGVIKKMPQGITVTLFRPFLWEIRKPIILISAMESLLIFLFTLYAIYKAGFLRFFKYLFTDPYIFLCIFFSLIFAGLVGISTLNFGTLSRYRIPIIPFYLFGLLLIVQKSLADKKETNVDVKVKS